MKFLEQSIENLHENRTLNDIQNLFKEMKPEYIRTSLKRMWLEEFFNFAENNVNIYSIYSFFTNLAKLNFISDSYRFITL
jgi:hypothetical protein